MQSVVESATVTRADVGKGGAGVTPASSLLIRSAIFAATLPTQ
jgi:hypothetical protein